MEGDKFMQEIHLKQPSFIYSACDPLTKNKERIEKFMQTGNTNFIYRIELDKACLKHDKAYGKSKDLIKRAPSDKLLIIQTTMVIKEDQLQWFINFLIKYLKEVVLLMNQIINWQMNFLKQLLENSKKEKFIHHLKIIFGVLI